MGRPYACDGPGCNGWCRTREMYRRTSWLHVVPSDARTKEDELYFCSWDCLLAYGMAFTQRTETV